MQGFAQVMKKFSNYIPLNILRHPLTTGQSYNLKTTSEKEKYTIQYPFLVLRVEILGKANKGPAKIVFALMK